MQVSKWGNSLALRLPASVVDALELVEGDDIEITVAGRTAFEVARDPSRQEALDRLHAMNLRLPAGYRFKRSHAYEA